MIKKRNGVFETNSSSVHSISISEDGMEKSNLPVKNGYVIARFGEFGNDFRLYRTQEEKLSYVVSLFYYICGWRKEDIYEDWAFREFSDAVAEYTGTKGVKIVGREPSIDHQSQPESSDGNDVLNLYNTSFLMQFVFNKYVCLKTDCD